jgi:hypothetical protein
VRRLSQQLGANHGSQVARYQDADSNADLVARAVAGTATIWTWACRNGEPYIKGLFVQQVDARGFHAGIWHVLTPDGTDRLVPAVAVTP